MSLKSGRPAANWVKELPTGEYSMKDLTEMTGKDKKTIADALRKYGAEVLEKIEGRSKRTFYKWNGFSLFSDFDKK